MSSSVINWFPAIKFQPPTLRPGYVARARLVWRLHEAILTHRLTVLSAPRGYGKSHLLSEWIQNHAGPHNAPVAWLGLDTSENDYTNFILALIAALQTVHAAVGVRVQQHLTDNKRGETVDSSADLQLLLGVLLIDIRELVQRPLALVLDGYECIDDPAVHDALDYLLRRMPDSLHVVVSSVRTPPLSFLRMHIDPLAAEFRVQHLALSEAETIQVLAMYDIAMSPAQNEIFQFLADGWAIGIHFLAQAFALGTINADEFLNRPTAPQTQKTLAQFFDHFYKAEVFDAESAPIRRFLLETSILEWLDPEICDAVTGRTDSIDILHGLYHRNRMLVPVEIDDWTTQPSTIRFHRTRFRYQRPFAAVLRRRLLRESPGRMRALHALAANALPASAAQIHHLVAAENWPEVVGAVARFQHSAPDAEQVQLVADLLLEHQSEVPASSAEVERMVRLLQNAPALPVGAKTLGLTARQYQVLRLVASGASNNEIAEELTVTLSTVKGHVREVMRKLDASSRRIAVEKGIALGILPAANGAGNSAARTTVGAVRLGQQTSNPLDVDV